MSDPDRWLDGGGPEGAEELLRSARPIRDLTPAEDARLARHVTRIAALPTTVVALWLYAKIAAAIAGVIVVTGGAVLVWQAAEEPDPPRSVERTRSQPVVAPVPEAPVEPAPEPTVAAPIADEERTPVERRTAEPRSTSLADEVALVEQARREAAGNPSAALATLRRYEREFPRGQLRLESEAIRIEALANAGRRAEARRRAERFLRAHPRAAYVDRIRQIAQP
jgi:hypothetical protein